MGSINAKVVLVGLDNSGKSSIVSKLKQPERFVHKVTPTVGYQSEQVSRNGVNIEILDMSGNSKYRDMWISYVASTNGIIFVVDSTDQMRLNVARSELQTLLEDKMLKKDTPILVYANKCDHQDSVDADTVTQALKMKSIAYPWKLCSSSVISGQGLQEGITWLTMCIKKQLQASKG